MRCTYYELKCSVCDGVKSSYTTSFSVLTFDYINNNFLSLVYYWQPVFWQHNMLGNELLYIFFNTYRILVIFAWILYIVRNIVLIFLVLILYLIWFNFCDWSNKVSQFSVDFKFKSEPTDPTDFVWLCKLVPKFGFAICS